MRELSESDKRVMNCVIRFGVCCLVTVTCGGSTSVNGTYFQNTGYPSTYNRYAPEGRRRSIDSIRLIADITIFQCELLQTDDQ